MFKCHEALRIRKENQSKYGHVNLPDCLPSTAGYHLDCYKKVTVLGKKTEKPARNDWNFTTTTWK